MRLLPLLLALPAAAAEPRPVLSPTRDVAVTYRVTSRADAPGEEGEVLRIAWLAAERKQRTDVVPGLWTIIERNSGTGIRVDSVTRTALRVPLSPVVLARFEPGPGAALTRGLEDRVAGFPCTNWSYRSDDGSGSLCLTADGIPLRLEASPGGWPARARATAVDLGAQDPARFRVPEGYRFRELVPPRPTAGPPIAGPPSPAPRR